jgi:hypothetical protein
MIHFPVRRFETLLYRELYRHSIGICSTRIASAGLRRKLASGGAVNVTEDEVSLERSEGGQRQSKNLKILKAPARG